jgi:hypothetical protein
MDDQAKPARTRGEGKLRDELTPNISESRPYATIVPAAIVPARMVLAVLRHELESEDDLYQMQRDGLRPIDGRGVAERFENQYTGQELELLIAAFARAGENSNVAEFRSEAEWIELACGKRARSAPEYHNAIRSLAEPHWMLDRHGDRHIIAQERPIEIVTEYDLAGGGGAPKNLSVRIAESLCRNRRSFHQVPLALSQQLRDGGLRRVSTAHVKLYLYVLTRVRSREPQHVMQLENIIAATGLECHVKNRQRSRAITLIRDGLNAMVGAHMLEEWEFLPGNRVGITPSKAHFRIRKSASKMSQSRTSVARVSVAECK